MCETGLVFTTQLTNSWKYWKINEKASRLGGLNFWQGQLCNLRANEMRDLLSFGKDIKTFLQIL